MSTNVPFEIQEEIIKRLPVKSLIRSRSVCKSWKSLIESSSFIANYSTKQQHLLVYSDEYVCSDPKYVSIVDDNTFPEHRVFATIPPSVRMLEHLSMKIGSCHGLLCLYGLGRVVIWNPSIRKTVAVVLPNVTDDKMYKTVLGFGVCHETSDPKIVKITYMDKDVESVASIIWQVEVFTLSTGAWRSRYGNRNLPNKAMYFGDQQNVDGVCYWIATDRSTVNDEIRADFMIISFDMTSEEFGEVKFPESFAYQRSMSYMDLYNVRESLVAVQCRYREDLHAAVYDVWMVENGVPRSFTKLFTIYTPDAEIRGVYEFRKSGEPVIEVDYERHRFLAVYEPNSKHISNLGSLNGINEGGFVVVHSYHMETLLLLDQPSFTVFDKGERYVESFKEES